MSRLQSRSFMWLLLALLNLGCEEVEQPDPDNAPSSPFEFKIGFEGLFSDGNTLTNAVADFDNDGDLDIFVGFRNYPNRLYRNDSGSYVDVAPKLSLNDADVTRSAAWGDFDNDGWVDLFVGFVSSEGSFNRLYRNEGPDRPFRDITSTAGVEETGSFRQVNWIDFDGDGQLDLYIGFRDKPNVLLRNRGADFTDVAEQVGVADARKTVGAAWFDYEQDGDLDIVVANMDGDPNGLFRNDAGYFTDVAEYAGISDGGRTIGNPQLGTVRPTIADFNNDGRLDILMANYGPTALYLNKGDGTFKNVAEELGLAIDARYDAGTWADVDHDGRLDLYINGTIAGGISYPDYLFRNTPSEFKVATPSVVQDQNADHGAHWADMDLDGDLDLLLTGAAPDGMHHLMVNVTKHPSASSSIQIRLIDEAGRRAMPGTEVRLFDSATGELLGTRMLDTGSGYNAQNDIPVHFGVKEPGPVDVHVTFLSGSVRQTIRTDEVDPDQYVGRWLRLPPP